MGSCLTFSSVHVFPDGIIDSLGSVSLSLLFLFFHRHEARSGHQVTFPSIETFNLKGPFKANNIWAFFPSKMRLVILSAEWDLAQLSLHFSF